MCWSAEVSLGFALAEGAALGTLWWRQGPRDRGYALATLPIATQEALQAGLWKALEAPGCHPANAWLTLAVQLVVGFVPVAFTAFAVHQARCLGRQSPAGPLLLAVAVSYMLVRALAMGATFATAPICTTVGPNHHQVWGDLLRPYGGAWVGLVSLGLYAGLPLAAIGGLLRPAWVAVGLVAVGFATLVPTLLLFPQEHSSVWCWACSAFLAFALLDPVLARRLDRAR